MRLGNLQREQTEKPHHITAAAAAAAAAALATPQRLHAGSKHHAEQKRAAHDITAISS